MKKCLVLGAPGFLGSHLERRLKNDGHFVVSVGRSHPRYRTTVADHYHHLDLSRTVVLRKILQDYEFDEIFQLASESGGLGYIATGEHDASIMANSTKINLHLLDELAYTKFKGKVFFASSQCVYPDDPGIDPFAQERITEPRALKESDASFNTFPFAQEKLYAERLFMAYAGAHGFSLRIGRIGNTYGPYCIYDGPRSKAVAALCTKVARAPYAGVVDMWGAGTAVRSFTYVEDVVDGILRLTQSSYSRPVNIASSEGVTINQLFEMICKTANKILGVNHIAGPVGVSHRVSDNTLCREVLGWEPTMPLAHGLGLTYPWIAQQIVDGINL